MRWPACIRSEINNRWLARQSMTDIVNLVQGKKKKTLKSKSLGTKEGGGDTESQKKKQKDKDKIVRNYYLHQVHPYLSYTTNCDD